MSATLLLLRHAKSSWDDPALDDRDRPLAPRGRGAAELIAHHLRRRGGSPDLVLCSDAARTRETLAIVASGFDPAAPPRIEFEHGLYGAAAERLLEHLRRLPEQVGTAMLVGHNPGMRDLVLLVAEGASAELDARIGKFPTAALATFEVPSWAELGPGAARLSGYVKPKELG